ncbi:uncharacterized protein LOC129016656 [Pongo pygmaeus]|uniref:uncharacterized protein LOC129016656 n=1 Tax=Pongo pygmaeus TaxID=9600 RepID=UPI0023E093CB|nr:uncharacterized protein LOC129016656 [Pongo pygmaeus]
MLCTTLAGYAHSACTLKPDQAFSHPMSLNILTTSLTVKSPENPSYRGQWCREKLDRRPHLAGTHTCVHRGGTEEHLNCRARLQALTFARENEIQPTCCIFVTFSCLG